MKRKLLLLSVAISSLSFAQTTLTKSFNDPVVGDVLTNVNINGAINNSPTGANVTFNNSSVTSGATSINNYTSPTAAELVDFPLATIKHSDGNGINVYYKQSIDKLEIVGIDNPAGTLKFTNPGTAINYPTSFGTTTTDQAQGTVSASGTTAYFRGNIVSNADATGTLILGNQTFNNILRLKITQNYTIYLDSTLFVPVGTATNTSYMYFDAAHKFPLLSYADASIVVSLAGINESTSGAQAQDFIFLGTKEIKKNANLMLYPNPTKDKLFVQSIGEKAQSMDVFSMEGKKVGTYKINDNGVDVSSLEKGIYLLRITYKDGSTIQSKFIKD